MKAGFLAAHYKGLGDGGGKGSHAHRPFMPLFGKAFVSLWPSYPPQMSKNGPSLRTYSRIEQLSRTLTLRIKDWKQRRYCGRGGNAHLEICVLNNKSSNWIHLFSLFPWWHKQVAMFDSKSNVSICLNVLPWNILVPHDFGDAFVFLLIFRSKL